MVSYLAIILLVTWEQNYLLALGIGTVTEVVLKDVYKRQAPGS